jgi:predicted glycogen debranching enzyme
MPRSSATPISIADGRLLSALTAREWLLADGRGGYALGTHGGLNTRKYHGLLVVSRPAPDGRLLLVSRLEETLVVENDERIPLDVACYEPGILHPDGYRHLVDFALLPAPTWTYRAAGRELRRTVALSTSGQGVRVTWDLVSGEPAVLLIRPLLTRRSHHAVARERDLSPEVTIGADEIAWRPRKGDPATLIRFSGEVGEDPAYFYRDALYSVERERGYDAVEDLHSPCVLRFDLDAESPAGVAFAAEDEPPAPPSRLPRAVSARRRNPVNDAARDALVAAADTFLIQGQDAAAGIVAGYPWFEEWGRDTMIALPGLCLSTGRPELAFRLLDAWASRLSGGLLPNRLGDRHAVETNSADAPLFMIRAIERLDLARWDRKRVEKRFFEPVCEVLDAYHDGTLHGIRADADGLLRAGEEGLALTWMDAIVEKAPVTPRRGKPVELNALYLDGLRYGAELCDRRGENERGALYRARRLRVEAAMRDRFVDPATGFIRDVVDAEGPGDPNAFRPNLLFAISAVPSPIAPADAEKNLSKVEADLLTPFGLRTLAPDHPDYVGAYQGDQPSRDRAYHQGTVWPWLIGPYADALVSVHGDGERVREKLATALAPLLRHAIDHGTLPEVYDGDHPHHPGGCPAQAWSVAEVLRVLTFIES